MMNFDDKGAHKLLCKVSNLLERDTSGEKQEHRTISKVSCRAPPIKEIKRIIGLKGLQIEK